MLTVDDSELLISFPEVDEEANLRIHFREVTSPSTRLRLRMQDNRWVVPDGETRFVVYLEPNRLSRDLGYWGSEGHYPFAILLSVGGLNAITGLPNATMPFPKQNYFISPPQGGIDGYYREGMVYPFRIEREMIHPVDLRIQVHPLKREMIEYYRMQSRLVGGRVTTLIRGLTLEYGGARDCEPIYEDLCGFGSWDQTYKECISIGIAESMNIQSNVLR